MNNVKLLNFKSKIVYAAIKIFSIKKKILQKLDHVFDFSKKSFILLSQT